MIKSACISRSLRVARLPVAALVTALLLGAVWVSPAAASWGAPETAVPGIMHKSNDPSIAVDEDGNQHAVFVDGSGGIRYTGNAGGSWSAPVVVSGPDGGCQQPSVAVDSAGVAHVAYNWRSEIRYVENSSGWSAPVTVSDTESQEPSIDTDSSGDAHIAYNWRWSEIRYVENSSGWSAPVTVSGTDWNCREPSLDVDSSDDAQVAYAAGEPATVRYVENSSGWSAPVTASGGETDCYQPSLKTDSSGDAHIAYNWSYSEIRYVENSSGWSAPARISGTDWNCREPSLDVCSLDWPHVAYTANNPEQQRYTHNVGGGGWSTPEAVGFAGRAMNASLGVDPLTDRPHLLFTASDSGSDIMYTTRDTSWAGPVNISTPGEPPQNERAALAYDASGTAHLAAASFADGVSGILYCNRPAGGTWSAPETVSGDDSGCSGPAIAVDPHGAVHIAYGWRDVFSRRIRYVEGTPGSWSAPVTASGPDTDCENPSLGVDSAAAAHVAYGRAGSEIRYVENSSGGSWSAPARISGSDWDCREPSLDVDSSDDAQVAYSAGHPSIVRYVENSSGWSAPVTASVGETDCYQPSLETGASGDAHIAYNWRYSEIHYVENSSGWSSPVTVSGTDSFCETPSPGLDPLGNAYVAYYEGGGRRIRCNDEYSGSWGSPVTASDSDPESRYPSLSMHPGLGTPGVAYISEFNVRFAQRGAQPPRVTGVSPTVEERGRTANLEITGTGFRPGAAVRLEKDGASIAATAVDVTSPTRISCGVPIPAGSPVGPWDVVVENDDAQVGRLAEGLVIEYASPRPAAVEPGSCEAGSTVRIAVTGNHFRGGAEVLLTRPGGSVILKPVDLDVVSATTIRGTLKIPEGVDLGPWDLTVRNDDGKSGTAAGALQMKGRSPAITSVYPSSGFRGATLDVEIDGANTSFSKGESRATFSGEGITVNSTEVRDRGRVKANISIAPDAPTGRRDVNVITGKQTPVPLSGGFTVNPQADTWYLAEGSTGWDFETWVAVMNPGDEKALAALTFLTDEGPVAGPTLELDPDTRQTVNLSVTVPNTGSVSTVVNSDGPVVCERSMYWANRTGGHSSIGVNAPSTLWYIAEGCTGGDFETWVAAMNPGDATATATFTFMTESGEVAGPTVEIEPHSRKTVDVSATVPGSWSVSTVVNSDGPVVCERSMYWANRAGGHSSIGVNTPSTLWYIAEGCTGFGFETWVLIENPGNERAVADLVYLTGTGPVTGPTVTLEAGTRKTVNLADTIPDAWSAATVVDASAPVVVERSMYWDDRGGGHSSIGSAAPSFTWYLPEGSTAAGFEDWVLVLNPSAWRVDADVTFMTENGPVEGPSFELGPWTRATVRVSDYAPGAFSVAAAVTADGPVVAERAGYWGNRVDGSSSVGFGAGY